MKKFLLFSCMFFVFSFKVYASHLELYKISGVYSSQFNMDNGSYFSSNQKRYVMDGKTVYCVEPGIDIMTREYMSLDLSYSNFSNDVLERISLIGHYGYDYPGHYTDRYFMAAQELIWEVIGNNEVHFTTGIDDTGDYINIDYEKNEIMNFVNSYYLKPSFDGSLYDGILGEELVLTDSNHVLSNYEVISGNAYIDGDNLVISVDKLGDDEILFSRKKYDDLSSVYYMAYNSQDFMFFRAPSIVSSVSINGYVPYSSINIYKTGDVLSDFNGEFIYEENGISGISFGLYSEQNIYVNNDIVYMKDDLVDELITVDGYASSINIPNGKYYLREIDGYDDLIMGEDIHIDINNNSPLVYKYDLNLKNERKKTYISIDKKGEIFDDLDSFHYDGLEGVSFGLYSHDDIYSYDGRLLVDRDSLIDTFVTDCNGNVLVDIDLPISSYYFKELVTPNDYILDDSIYDVSYSNDEFISYGVESINYLKKGSLNINKYNIYGDKLDGAYFKLYRDGNLIYDGSTFNGFISIDNLPYGQYKLFEASAPSGYVSDYNFFDILIDDSTVSIDVYNEMLPITSDIYLFKKVFSYVCIGFGFLGILYDKRVKGI